MNKLKNIGAFILLFSIVIVSCTVEPYTGPMPVADTTTGGGGGGGPVSTSIVGSYTMTAFNTSVSTDLNSDGTASTNQMTETTCFNNNTIVLNANNTFTATQKGVDIDSSGATDVLTCYADPNITGTWSLVNSTLTLTYMDTGVQYNDVYALVGSTLKMVVNQGDIVGMVGGQPVTLTANIDIVYTKQ
jgi:hypothetical protein